MSVATLSSKRRKAAGPTPRLSDDINIAPIHESPMPAFVPLWMVVALHENNFTDKKVTRHIYRIQAGKIYRDRSNNEPVYVADVPDGMATFTCPFSGLIFVGAEADVARVSDLIRSYKDVGDYLRRTITYKLPVNGKAASQ